MTLAVAILMFGLSSFSFASNGGGAQVQSAQEGSTTQSVKPSSNQEQSQSGTKASNESKPASTSSAQKNATRRTAVRKKSVEKKTANAGCDSSITPDPAQASSASANGKDPSAAQSGTQQAPPTNQAPSKNCPPEKVVVVRHGGTDEPSIQLAGGDQESQKRKDVNQMLGSAEANLKKISSIQLSAEQQDAVSQIRQFVDQSKAALASGDLERGHTLAWKAQLLSEDLVKPQK